MKYTLLLLAGFFTFQLHAQNGISWNMATDISVGNYGNAYPRMALNGSGNPLVVWGDMMSQSVYFSRWTGASFSTPIKLNPSWLSVASASWMGPDIAAKGDTVYVVVKRMPETSDTNRIFVFRSFNGGINFDPPVELAFIGDSLSRFPTLAVDELGNPLVAFMKFDPSFINSRWVVAKSSDFGNTFSTDVIAGGYSGSGSEACDCCPGALVTSGPTMAMVYRDNLNDIRDIWAGISIDNGQSFPDGFAADNTNWMVLSCPASGPDGVIIGDTLYTTYMSAGSGNYRTYLSRSSISNGTMGSKMNLTGPITGLSQQNYPRIANDGKAMAIVWKQTISSLAQVAILFTNDLAAGLPSSSDTVDLANVTNTDVVMRNGNIFVIWQDDQSKTVKYRYGTYAPAVSVGRTSAVEPGVYPNPASTSITIEFATMQNARLSIQNSLGEELITQTGMEDNRTTMDISFLKAGIYFIHIHQNDLIFTRKFIKL